MVFPHADSSHFAPGLSKAEVYSQLLEQAKVLLDGQRNWKHRKLTINSTGKQQVSNFANVASLLWHAFASLPEPSSAVNWAGFYVRQDKFPSLRSSSNTNTQESLSTKILLLGPFHGKPACQLIQFGRGVCGTAAAKRETVLVPDVLNWEGHIACDAESRSEIVVPILVNGETVALIDIDCAVPSGFDEVDREGLENLAAVLAEGCDW
ncbi:GAF domain nucleotide-binding protein [Paracoccidioides lutzii Pb01]|uniref:GAF domain nucleotide-binding protein n=1 Tax=Paracoccidioides lutzii (strain ATCC MYA-826 / Pb01) TaxID=502779 RepID=C1GZ39_PARBA|nr:GAF domain nucleotide-binding protein [Paracoccidioides lutzii Pb01]EEH41862.2 GAF domain nucleotide-binding protein [Paracoccidioides lutzii Pb01]